MTLDPASVVDAVGWAGTVSGTILGLPQVLRLLRTGRVDGLSLPAWQAMLVVNLSWTAHGLSIGQLPQIVTSALSLCSTLPILYLMARELNRRVLLVLAPGLLAAGALVGVDQVLGSAAFGAAAIISNAGQSIELVRSPRIVGVSVMFLILAVVNQALWLWWAILVPDTGTIIAAAVTGAITVFNLTWWSLRYLGLGRAVSGAVTCTGRDGGLGCTGSTPIDSDFSTTRDAGLLNACSKSSVGRSAAGSPPSRSPSRYCP